MQDKHVFPQYLAEFIGTFFMVFFGCGALILSQQIPSGVPGMMVPLVFGGAVSVMIYATGHISGAHFNPAVTVAFAVARKFPLMRIPGYIAAQCAGALLASFVHSLIWSHAHNFGATGSDLSVGGSILVEAILSFALMFVIIAVATDTRAVGELAGIAIGTTVAVCAFVGGPLTGASMNPARTLGPAVLNGDISQLWTYIVGPIAGTVIGAWTYEYIRCHKDAEAEHGCC